MECCTQSWMSISGTSDTRGDFKVSFWKQVYEEINWFFFVFRLVLLALEDGTALTRKVLILFIMQRLAPHFPLQASKTAIGHVIQILYRASCFDVIKRNGDSSLMMLKEEFRDYPGLRREHDTQIVSISLEAGLKISPEQWSSLLYGDLGHKSSMQSIIDKLYGLGSGQVAPSFDRLLAELKGLLQGGGGGGGGSARDPVAVRDVLVYFDQLAYFSKLDFTGAQEEVENDDQAELEVAQVSAAIDAVSFITIKLLTFHQYHWERQHAQQQQQQPQPSFHLQQQASSHNHHHSNAHDHPEVVMINKNSASSVPNHHPQQHFHDHQQQPPPPPPPHNDCYDYS